MIPGLTTEVAFKKTRIAPTPSGYLHLGNVLSFAITASLAQHSNARILLRIDDVDRERTDKKYVQDIFDTLDFLGIEWHEGPKNIQQFEREYSQMCRMNLYTDALSLLREQNLLFACTCSRADIARLSADSSYTGACSNRRLPFDAPATAWRMHTNNVRELEMRTLKGMIKATLPQSVQEFVVRKKDGFPAYQLTSLIDDIHFGIDLIVRGEDLWPSSLAQLYLSAFIPQNNFAGTAFYHHPLIMNAGEKLSKSGGATSVQYLRKEHKKPADIFALIAHMLGSRATPANIHELAALIAI